MTHAPTEATTPESEWTAQGLAPGRPRPAARAPGRGQPRPKGRRPPLRLGQVPSSLLMGAGRVPGLPYAVGVSNVNPPCLY